MKSSSVRVSPNSNENVPMRDRKGHKDGGTGHVRREQIGVKWPQAKECQGHHKLEEVRNDPPLEP